MKKIIFLLLIIATSTSWLYFLKSIAPRLSELDDINVSLKFPGNLSELKEIAKLLKTYNVNHWWYVLLLYGSAYIYKQAFCVPGSLLLNFLAGALYGHIGGLFFACFYTAVGATMCFFLSSIFAKNIVLKCFPQRLISFQKKVEENKSNLFYFMLFIRLVPVAPGWVINLIAPLVDIPPGIFFITTLIGLGPYNFVGVSAGNMLSSLNSIDEIFTWKTFLSIIVIAAAAIGPAYIINRRYTMKKNSISKKIM